MERIKTYVRKPEPVVKNETTGLEMEDGDQSPSSPPFTFTGISRVAMTYPRLSRSQHFKSRWISDMVSFSKHLQAYRLRRPKLQRGSACMRAGAREMRLLFFYIMTNFHLRQRTPIISSFEPLSTARKMDVLCLDQDNLNVMNSSRIGHSG